MDSTILLNKLEVLPEHLQSEMSDFIDFLILKATKEPNPDNYLKPKFGSGKGMFVMQDDFDEPLEDFKEYMDK